VSGPISSTADSIDPAGRLCPHGPAICHRAIRSNSGVAAAAAAVEQHLSTAWRLAVSLSHVCASN